MPCYDPRPHTVVEYKSGISPEQLKAAKECTKIVEAVLCAIFNELERRDMAESVIAEASRHGRIDIMSFWTHHKKEDKARIISDFHYRYSKDEQAIILKTLETS